MVVNFISQAELASILRVSLKTLQNRLSERPQSLPLPIRFEGSKSPVWHPRTVEVWQESLLSGSSYTTGAQSNSASPIKTEEKKKEKRGRGRPTNAERFARGDFNART